MSIPDDLRRELATFADAPFEQARMLPLEAYRSPAVLAAEHAAVLAGAWHCLARTADLPNPGDHLTGEMPHLHDDGTPGTRSVLVVHGDDGVVRAFDNVCVHRGAPLVSGCGNEARFTCPYHAWTYRLDGQLIGAPHMGRSFEPADHRLGQLAVEVWQGFVFVNADPQTAALAPTIAGLTDVVGAFAIDGYVPVHRQVDVWSTNWKLLVENFMDAYHVFKVHRATFGADSDSPSNTTMHPGTDAWAYHVAAERAEVAHPDNTSLVGDWRSAVVLAAVFPTHVMQLQPDYLWYLQISPIGTDRVRIRWDVSVAPEMLAAQPDPEAYVASLVELLTAVNAEDQPIVEGVRRSADGPTFRRGPFSVYERNVYDFDRYIARRLATDRDIDCR
ncbi:MAG: aromatic ring-hydroxylating dioxygenase subunit alpha [Ilumatobacteraceae bacterium]